MQTQPAESKEDDNSRPEYPFVFPRPSLNHADRVPGDTKRVCDRVQLLLRALEHLALRTKVAQHRLTPGDVLVQRRIGASEEVLLPQRVVLARHVVAAHPISTTAATPTDACSTTCITHMSAATISTIRTRRRSAGAARSVGVLWRRGVWPSAEQLAAVLGVKGVVARGFQGLELLAVVGELGAEVAYALVGLLLLGRVELLLRKRVVLVDGALECGQGGAEGAERRGAYRGR